MTEQKTPYWWAAIGGARERGTFTPEDRMRAGSWPDCACGEQDPRIQREEGGIPKDGRLANLGWLFSDAVDSDDVDAAEELLVRIEKRAAEILTEVP